MLHSKTVQFPLSLIYLYRKCYHQNSLLSIPHFSALSFFMRMDFRFADFEKAVNNFRVHCEF